MTQPTIENPLISSSIAPKISKSTNHELSLPLHCSDNLPVTKTNQMKFSVSFCDPLSPGILELGDMEGEKILEIFESIPWLDYLVAPNPSDNQDIHYAPSLEIENKKLNIGLEIAAIDKNEWHLFFRKTMISNASESQKNEQTIGLTKQLKMDAMECLWAFLNIDIKYLEKKFRNTEG